jgi:hypothetical protein
MFLEESLGGFKVNKNLRYRYNKELMQPFGDLESLSLVSISRLNWIGNVNRTRIKRKVS